MANPDSSNARFQRISHARLLALTALWLSTAAGGWAQDDAPANLAAEVVRQVRAKDLDVASKSLGAVADSAASMQPTGDAGVGPAAGAFYRALAQRSVDEQYGLLYAWTMPSESRKTVRLLTTPVPQTAPPQAFARLLGERARADSFTVAAVGPVRGLFSSGWMLVRCAEETGRLRRLTAELDRLAAEGVPNADVLALLARLADPRADVSSLTTPMKQRAAEIRKRIPKGDAPPASIDMSDLAWAAAALTHDSLRPAAVDMLEAMVECTYGGPSPLRPFLRLAHATAVQVERGASGPEVLAEHRLKYWISQRSERADATDGWGAVGPIWLAQEDHILHLAGPGSDVLFCRFPLAGSFVFECETQRGGREITEGGVVYGGLRCQVSNGNLLTITDADAGHPLKVKCPYVVATTEAAFHRMTLESNEQAASTAVNLHPTWSDRVADAQASPWLGLHSDAQGRPAFRNLKITGQPIIPREVDLCSSSTLRGWRAAFYGETRPSPFANSGDANVNPDWQWTDGVLQAEKMENSSNAYGRLAYERPLLDGETIRYEFHYRPGEVEVHPAIGRLAFLIEPGGVRVRWMTDGALEWTGLPADNALLEPFHRRGPRPLPLKEDDWNQATISLRDGKVSLSLNGAEIYTREVDFAGDHAFSFYRERSKGAKIRNVVMTGDWPEKLPEDFVHNPAVLEESLPEAKDRYVRDHLMGELLVAGNVRSVRMKAAALSVEERFQFLSEWILPGASHATYRVSGEFTPTDPSPPVVELDPSLQPGDRGGSIVSPVFDLLDAAVQLGKLDQLAEAASKSPVGETEFQQRARAALLTLIHWERKDRDAAHEAAALLLELVKKATAAAVADQWPETLVVYRAGQRFPDDPLAGDLLQHLNEHRTKRNVPVGIEQWHTHIASLAAQLRLRLLGGTNGSTDVKELDQWTPIVRMRAHTRGRGCAHPQWLQNEANEIQHVMGHQTEFLLYQSPLRGNFEIECEVGGGRTTQLLAGDQFFGPTSSLDAIEIGAFRPGGGLEPLAPPLSKVEHWVRCRVVFRNGERVVYFYGRELRRDPVSEHSAPWIGFRSWWRSGARIRDLRITGDPKIPEAVVLSATKNLIGWLPYHAEWTGSGPFDWRYEEDPQTTGMIVRKGDPAVAGGHFESLLYYYRPLVEGGTVEYDFYYEPGAAETHPALDRLALLLQPEGVRVHWITDSPFDEPVLSPGNQFEEPAHRRGPNPLPLRPSAWNHVRLALAGDTLSVELNGAQVYERELEKTNRRTFGLFHFGEFDVRARNVVLRGNWPKRLPPAAERPLVDARVQEMDANLPRLKAVFEYDFTKSGLTAEYFSWTANNGGELAVGPDGTMASRPGIGRWAAVDLLLRFAVHGDFDIVAEFDQFTGASDKDVCVTLEANLDDPQQAMCRLARMHGQSRWHYLHSAKSLLRPDGNRVYSTTSQNVCEAIRGRLRMVRRGATVSYLFAENDSSVFRFLHSEVMSREPIRLENVILRVLCNGNGGGSAVWKNISLRAERLQHLSPSSAPPKRTLVVMKPDGSNVRELTRTPPPLLYLGSPEWSADGKKICFDASNGPTTTSHIFVINVDGSGLTDLGPGCMPSFSPDCKRIVFSLPGQGIVMMDADGGNRQIVDRQGWGVQWSPDGKYLAYGLAGNVMLMDVRTGEKRPLLVGADASKFGYVYWNLGWSNDSRAVAFKAQNRQTRSEEIAVVEIGSPNSLKVLLTNFRGVNADITFLPGDRKILFSRNMSGQAGARLFTVDRDAGGTVELFPNQPMDYKLMNCDWSPDGEWIAITTEYPPEPVEWSTTQTTASQ